MYLFFLKRKNKLLIRILSKFCNSKIIEIVFKILKKKKINFFNNIFNILF
jgi:hypothetical protein